MPIILAPITGGTGGGGGGLGAGANPDVLRIVTIATGGQTIPLFDLNDGTNYVRERETFKFTPGPPTPQVSRSTRRYGGARITGVTHDNGSISWTAIVRGDTQQDSADLIELLLKEIEDEAKGRMIEWRPPGVTGSSFLRIAGPGTWDPNYQWHHWTGSPGFMRTVVTFPVYPLVEWAPMTVDHDWTSGVTAMRSDTFLGEYTFDAGALTNMTYTASYVDASANFSTENRLVHTARGYNYSNPTVIVGGKPGSTITGWKLGAIVKRQSATTYVEGYVDDNGTNSRLRLDNVVSGVRTNLFSTNLASRVTSSSTVYVVMTTLGNVVTAEYYTSRPFSTTTSTLGIQAASTANPGAVGITWTPQATDSQLFQFLVRSYGYRNPVSTYPNTVRLLDVPGGAPAKVETTITPAVSTAWAMLGWMPTASSSVTTVPFGLIEAESDVSGARTGWSLTSNIAYHGGNGLQLNASGAGTTAAEWNIDPNALPPDEFTDAQVTVEVWARMAITGSLVSPTVTLSARNVLGSTYSADRYSNEYGSAGKVLPVPVGGSGTTTYRLYKLGTLTFPVNPEQPVASRLRVTGSVAAGSGGAFGLDFLFFVLSRARALGPTAKPLDSAYPRFTSAANVSKIINPDLSGAVLSPYYPVADHGLGGSLLELPPGSVDVAFIGSSVAPDDPSINTNTDTSKGEINAAIEFDVTPRSYFLRSS